MRCYITIVLIMMSYFCSLGQVCKLKTVEETHFKGEVEANGDVVVFDEQIQLHINNMDFLPSLLTQEKMSQEILMETGNNFYRKIWFTTNSKWRKIWVQDTKDSTKYIVYRMFRDSLTSESHFGDGREVFKDVWFFDKKNRLQKRESSQKLVEEWSYMDSLVLHKRGKEVDSLIVNSSYDILEKRSTLLSTKEYWLYVHNRGAKKVAYIQKDSAGVVLFKEKSKYNTLGQLIVYNSEEYISGRLMSTDSISVTYNDLGLIVSRNKLSVLMKMGYEGFYYFTSFSYNYNTADDWVIRNMFTTPHLWNGDDASKKVIITKRKTSYYGSNCNK